MKPMPKHPVIEKIEGEIEQTLRDFGYELVMMKFGGPAGHPTLAIYIDKPGGVTTKDCQYMTERLSVLLDILDPIETSYNLLVSSPGLDRPLTKDEDFTRFIGKKAAITFRDATGKRVSWQGQLRGVEEGEVLLEMEQELRRVPLLEIERARLIFEWPSEEEQEEAE